MDDLVPGSLFDGVRADPVGVGASSMDVVFSTTTVHARDRLDFWRSEASKVFVEHEFETTVGRAFKGTIRATSIGSFGLSSFESDQASVRHTTGCVRRATGDDLLICKYLTAGSVVHQDGRSLCTRIGDLCLIDPRRPFAIDVPADAVALVLKVPRLELEQRLGDVSGLTVRALSGHRPMVSLASGFLDMVVPHAKSLQEATSDMIVQQTLDLLALAIRSELREGAVAVSSPRSATLLRLKAVIEERLRDPELKPAIAAEAAGISVRYANSLLADEGTSLERYIVNRRLENCYAALVTPAHPLRTVSDVAYAWGFSDLSHFTRRFKARFGMSPRECRHRNAITQD